MQAVSCRFSIIFLMTYAVRTDDDDDIKMPDGPPPDADGDSGEVSDSDIPMPEGPPPPKTLTSGMFDITTW